MHRKRMWSMFVCGSFYRMLLLVTSEEGNDVIEFNFKLYAKS